MAAWTSVRTPPGRAASVGALQATGVGRGWSIRHARSLFPAAYWLSRAGAADASDRRPDTPVTATCARLRRLRQITSAHLRRFAVTRLSALSTRLMATIVARPVLARRPSVGPAAIMTR